MKVEVSQGIGNVVTMARTMGAPPWRCADPPGCTHFVDDEPLDAYGPSLTLGGYGETPLQMATGASVLAAGGLLRQIHSVVSITNPDGTSIFKSDPNQGAKQVVDPKVAFIMDQIMSDDSNRAMIFGRGTPLTLGGRHVGAKTGTTDNFTDGWTLGYTPDLAAAVWMGNPDFSPMVKGSDGVFVAAPAWHNFMQGALDAMGKGDIWFAEPAGLGHANGAWFLPGTSPSTPAPKLPAGVVTRVERDAWRRRHPGRRRQRRRPRPAQALRKGKQMAASPRLAGRAGRGAVVPPTRGCARRSALSSFLYKKILLGFPQKLKNPFGKNCRSPCHQNVRARVGRNRPEGISMKMKQREPTNSGTALPPEIPAAQLDRPIYTLSVASEILETHPRTLMMYEHLNMIKPKRTVTNRRRYSQRDLMKLQAIQTLTRKHGVNLAGVRYILALLKKLQLAGIESPEGLKDLDVTLLEV